MPFVDIGGVRLHYVEHGSGEVIVVSIHGNLACGHWFDLIGDRLPENLRVIAIDWRGCGDSDKPTPEPDYANYSIAQHARDMLAAIDALGIERCHLATHSTGGLISTYMLAMDPRRFGKVLALDPVAPTGLRFEPNSRTFFEIMKSSRNATRKGLALTVPTLFRPESLQPRAQPVYDSRTAPEQRRLFEVLVDKAFAVSDGIWFGTPFHLQREWENGGLGALMGSIGHEHLVLWGDLDGFIPREDMDRMATQMPRCRLVIETGVGHSMIVERPELYATHLRQFFGAARA